MRTSQEIIQGFIDSGCKHMANLPNNRVYCTENTASVIVWAEGNVVIEYYLLFPNKETPMHTHPFDNQTIHLWGDIVFRARLPNQSVPEEYVATDSLRGGYLTPLFPMGGAHGFIVGPRGGAFYNIQIWPTNVTTPISASIEYYGTPMGPVHASVINPQKPIQ